jgi:hypothetical protein
MSDASSQEATRGSGLPVPPPLPATAPEADPKLMVPLVRIPGMPEDGEPRRLSVGDKVYSIADIIALSRSGNEKSQRIAVKILGALEGLSRSELHLACSALHAASHEYATLRNVARESLYKLISTNSNNLEAIHLGCQIAKQWSSIEECAELFALLVALLNSTVKNIRFDVSATRRQCVERRYVLLKALEIEELRPSTCESMRSILSDKNEQFRADRKELAGNILAYLRLNPISSPHVNEVKRLATPALTSGLTTVHAQRTKAVDIDRATICTTALEAELRRQFGLACALEVSKALKLLGRSMRIEEYERAITFSSSSPHSEPTNRSWFSKDEWATAARLVQLGKSDRDILPEKIAALLYVLATRIKAEDHSDPRDSRRRVDAVGAEERKCILLDVQKLCDQHDISMATVISRADQIVIRALPAPFDTWRFEQHVEPKKPEAHVPAPTQKERSTRTSQIIAKLLRDDNPSTVTRMVPEELHLLRQVENLSVEEFKVITQRLQTRAVSDAWARTSILDLVRLPHASAVTAKVRTAALGALISEARRLGRLSVDLEKEVFAVSAEIPSLPFLAPESDEDQEFLLHEQDDDF